MAGEKFSRKTTILAKIEAVEGTDSLPTGAANAILVSNVTVTPLEGDVVERDNLQPHFGGQGSKMVSFYRKVAFSVEAAGVSAPGAAPGYSALLRACGLSVTLGVGVSATYAPVSDAMESVTIYASVDGLLHRLMNAKGTVRLAGDAKTLPKWEFDFTGTFVPVTDAARPAVDYVAFMDPLGVNKANTTLSLHGVPVAASAFSLDLGNTVVKRDLINVDSIAITGRKAIGSVTFQATSVATKDWVGAAAASAVAALDFVHGLGASNVIEIHGPRVQLGKPSYSEQDGVQMITTPLEYVPSSAGNDELSIVIR